MLSGANQKMVLSALCTGLGSLEDVFLATRRILPKPGFGRRNPPAFVADTAAGHPAYDAAPNASDGADIDTQQVYLTYT